MAEAGGRVDLAQESHGTQNGAEVRLQDLDRDLAAVLEVFREVDRCHAPMAQLSHDAVAVRKGGVKS